MKVFDASGIIGILQEIGQPEIIDMILKLGHTIAVPSAIVETELVGESISRAVRNLITQGKITVLEASRPDELREFKREFSELGRGEAEVILYCKRSGDKDAYGILDEKKARAAARKIGIKYTGLVGLIQLLGDRGVAEPGEIRRMFEAMNASTFRAPIDIIGNFTDD